MLTTWNIYIQIFAIHGFKNFKNLTNGKNISLSLEHEPKIGLSLGWLYPIKSTGISGYDAYLLAWCDKITTK